MAKKLFHIQTNQISKLVYLSSQRIIESENSERERQRLEDVSFWTQGPKIGFPEVLSKVQSDCAGKFVVGPTYSLI